jgi:hypothetical protein
MLGLVFALRRLWLSCVENSVIETILVALMSLPSLRGCVMLKEGRTGLPRLVAAYAIDFF